LNEFNRLLCAFFTTRVVQYYDYWDVRVTILVMTSNRVGIVGKTFSKVCTKTSCMRARGYLMRHEYVAVGLAVPQIIGYLIPFIPNIMTDTCSGRFRREKNLIFLTQYEAVFNTISGPYKLIYVILLRLSMLWKSIHCIRQRTYIEKGLSPMALQRHLSSILRECKIKIPRYWNKEELVINSKTI